MTMETLITAATDGQKKQVKRLVEDAVDSAFAEGLLNDKDRIQRLIENGDEFQADITASIKKHSLPNRFAEEEVRSNYTYPKEYKGPKPINDQIKAIAKIFDLDPSQALEFAKNLPVLPDGAEGWFAIPSVDALAKKHFPEVTDPAQKYCQAVQLVHAKIVASRSFYNYREGQITPAQLRVHARTAHALDLIAKTQKGDLPTGQAGILIVAAQLGMRHRGKSVRRAREVFTGIEFGLGPFETGCMLLTHPERLANYDDLWIDCAGNEFSPGAGGVFSESPYFYFYGGVVEFDTHFVGNPHDHFGSASGFLPDQQLP